MCLGIVHPGGGTGPAEDETMGIWGDLDEELTFQRDSSYTRAPTKPRGSTGYLLRTTRSASNS